MIVQMEESILQIQQRHSLLIACATVALIHCVYLRTQHTRDTLYYSFCQSQSDSKKPGYLSTTWKSSESIHQTEYANYGKMWAAEVQLHHICDFLEIGSLLSTLLHTACTKCSGRNFRKGLTDQQEYLVIQGGHITVFVYTCALMYLSVPVLILHADS